MPLSFWDEFDLLHSLQVDTVMILMYHNLECTIIRYFMTGKG